LEEVPSRHNAQAYSWRWCRSTRDERSDVVPSLAFRAVVILVGLLSTAAIQAAGPATATHTPVAVLAFDAPLTVTADPLVSSERPVLVRFTVSNTGVLPIRDYALREFVFRPDGRPSGFTRAHLNETLAPGAEHSGVVSLGEHMGGQARDIVLITVAAVSFQNGERWQAPDDAVERAKAEALRLAADSPAP
jgi:hypothetical protein